MIILAQMILGMVSMVLAILSRHVTWGGRRRRSSPHRTALSASAQLDTLLRLVQTFYTFIYPTRTRIPKYLLYRKFLDIASFSLEFPIRPDCNHNES